MYIGGSHNGGTPFDHRTLFKQCPIQIYVRCMYVHTVFNLIRISITLKIGLHFRHCYNNNNKKRRRKIRRRSNSYVVHYIDCID